MKNCKYCGRENDDNTTRCRECGLAEFRELTDQQESEVPETQRKSITVTSRDPLLWCGICFIVAFMGHWFPVLASLNDGPDSRIGMVMIYTWPFVLAAAVRSIFACRRLFIETSHSDELRGYARSFGLILTLGTLWPAAWTLFVIVSTMISIH